MTWSNLNKISSDKKFIVGGHGKLVEYYLISTHDVKMKLKFNNLIKKNYQSM